MNTLDENFGSTTGVEHVSVDLHQEENRAIGRIDENIHNIYLNIGANVFCLRIAKKEKQNNE